MPRPNQSKRPRKAGARLPDPSRVRQLHRKLTAWFHRNKRDLPWRADRDPYRIWVSEVMLQQTQVSTVIPYFHRFLQAFPTLAALAAAEEQQVLRLWEGLGYYRRARSLHRAAQELNRVHRDEVPDDPAVLQSLPGIGRYTLGAILSQAFDRPMPIVDANVARVLARWFAWEGDLRSARTQAWLWQVAGELLPRCGAGDWNQALMELGALVCTPRVPACERCPVRQHCAAQQRGVAAVLPRKPKAPTVVVVREVALVLKRRGRFLLLQRPPNAHRGAGLWEFPHGEQRSGESVKAAGARMMKELTGLSVKVGSRLTRIKHGITRFTIHLDCHTAELDSGQLRPRYHARGCWFHAVDVAELPMATPQRQLAAVAFENLAR